MRLASVRANSIMAQGSQSPNQEAADTFAVPTCPAITCLERGADATARRSPQGQAACGGALRAALTRPPRRGHLQLRDEGRAFVAIDESQKRNGL